MLQGLGQLRDKAKQLAKADATVLVQRFGELGKRKFNLAASTALAKAEGTLIPQSDRAERDGVRQY